MRQRRGFYKAWMARNVAGATSLTPTLDALKASGTLKGWWTAKSLSGTSDPQTITDQSGNSHDAQFGSTAGADTNDPTFLDHTGTDYLWLPGIVGNNASTPDAAVLDITGDIDLRAHVALDDWTPGSVASLVSKWGGSNPTRSYKFRIETNGRPRLFWYDSGASSLNVQASTAPTVTDGDLLWVRVTMDVDDGAGNRVITFYTSTNGSDWTQLGTATTTAGTTSVQSGSGDLTVGAEDASGEELTGIVRRAQVYDGIDGTLVFDADFTDSSAYNADLTELTEAANSATVTINRATSGKKAAVVDRPLLVLGTDDYLEIADHADLDFAADESLSLVVAGRVFGANADQVLAAKKDNLTTAAGYALTRGSGGLAPVALIADGSASSNDVAPSITAGSVFVVALRRDVAADEVEGVTDGTASGSPTTDATTATLANALPLRIGATSGTAASFLDGEIMGVALVREADADSDLGAIGSELLLQ